MVEEPRRTFGASGRVLHRCFSSTTDRGGDEGRGAAAAGGEPGGAEWLQKLYAHAVDMLSQAEPESLLISQLHAKKEHQVASVALKALDLELGSIVAKTGEARGAGDGPQGSPRQMRLLWWKQTLDRIFAGDPPEHPLAQLLTPVALQLQPDPRLFHAMVEMHEAAVGDAQAASTEQLMDFCGGTAGALLQLELECVGQGSQEARAVADHLGRAVGLVRVLRSIVQDARVDRLRIPFDQLGPSFLVGGLFEAARAGGDLNLLEGKTMPMMVAEAEKAMQELPLAVKVLHSIARDHIAKARALRSSLPASASQATPVFLAVAPAEQYLDRWLVSFATSLHTHNH